MGASWVGHPSWELVEVANEVTGRDVAELLLTADEVALKLTENAQLATFVLSLVVLDAAERLGLEPAALAGHSLGEYSALVASGALGYEDGLRLVAERGAAMRDAAEQQSGTMMAVIGLDEDATEAACARAEGEAWVANYNSPGQVVIAGTPEALARAGEIAKELGARRVLPLPVGGAFHTPLMSPAREQLRKALAVATFRVPEPAVVANVDARPHEDPGEWPGLLSAQLCSPVRWRQTLHRLAEDGARTFAELGPGGVLTGLVRRTLEGEEYTGASVATPAELEAFVESLTIPVEHAAPSANVEQYAMTERLVVSPSTGRFRPVEAFAASAPTLDLARGDAAAAAEIVIAVGELIGWAGESEIRSPFAGTLQGIIVLAGERVVAGQPVAWLRASSGE
jgi:[acyl-carrier-protein] S-malonyltransferase